MSPAEFLRGWEAAGRAGGADEPVRVVQAGSSVDCTRVGDAARPDLRIRSEPSLQFLLAPRSGSRLCRRRRDRMAPGAPPQGKRYFSRPLQGL